MEGLRFDAEVVAERLKEVRTEHHESMRKLAADVGSSKSSICFWEQGKILHMKTSDITKIANHYGVDPMWLMGFDVPKIKEDIKHKSKRDAINRKLEFFNMEELAKVEQLVDLLISMKKQIKEEK